MKHKIGFNRLERRQGHRKALKSNMVTSLFRYERVETTKAKALEIKRVAEKMVTRARIDSVHNRRIIAQRIRDNEVLAKLFTDIAPRYVERPGGYTRILKTGRRQGDAAEMVILEFVDRVIEEKAKPRAEKESSKRREAPVEQEREAPEAEEQEAPARTARTKKSEPAPATEETEVESEESGGSAETSVDEPDAQTSAAEPEKAATDAPSAPKKRARKPKSSPAEDAEPADEPVAAEESASSDTEETASGDTAETAGDDTEASPAEDEKSESEK